MCKLPNNMHELLTARELEKQEVESLKDKLEEINRLVDNDNVINYPSFQLAREIREIIDEETNNN